MNDDWRESLPRNQIVGFDQVKDDDAHYAHGLAPSLLPFSWILQSGALCFGAEGKADLARAIRVALGAKALWASVVALASMAALLSSTNALAAVLLRNDRPTLGSITEKIIFLQRAERHVCRTRWNRLTSGNSELPGSPSESSGVKSYDRRNVTIFFGDFCPSFFLFKLPF